MEEEVDHIVVANINNSNKHHSRVEDYLDQVQEQHHPVLEASVEDSEVVVSLASQLNSSPSSNNSLNSSNNLNSNNSNRIPFSNNSNLTSVETTIRTWADLVLALVKVMGFENPARPNL